MIAGYCWPQSVLPGERVAIFCAAKEAKGSEVALTVKRCGADQVLVHEGRHSLSEQDVDAPESWTVTAELEVPDEWPSGFYLVTLEDEAGCQNEAFFVVRSAEPSQALLVLATSTWAAYNDWRAPSFYTGGYQSSLRRPLPRGMLRQSDPHLFRLAQIVDRSETDNQRMIEERLSPWSNAAGWANWEALFVSWAERHGYQFGYATSQDLDRDANLLAGYGAYISVGHDEYWSAGMRDNVEAFVKEGGRAAFFSGNTSFWQIRYNQDHSTITSHKMAFQEDPVFQEDALAIPELSTMWSDPLVGRPENTLTGVSFTRGGYAHMPNSPRGTGGYQVWQPDHWAFAGLELNSGDQLGAEGLVVGYECDGCELDWQNGKPVATGRDGTPAGFQVLASAPARLWETEHLPEALRDDYIGELNWVAARIAGGDTAEHRANYDQGHAVMGSFASGKGEVFTVGCTDWAYGLNHADVDAVTRNVLDRFLTE